MQHSECPRGQEEDQQRRRTDGEHEHDGHGHDHGATKAQSEHQAQVLRDRVAETVHGAGDRGEDEVLNAVVLEIAANESKMGVSSDGKPLVTSL